MSSSSSSSELPHIHLLCMNPEYSEAFKSAAIEDSLPSNIQITHHNNYLSGISSSDIQFDCIVSPANSYGFLDGGFDDAISKAFSPADKYHALTKHAQSFLYDQYRGFAPPGTCTLIDIPKEFADKSKTGDRWGCRWLALCPTMWLPDDVNWDRQVVYECIWTLLCAVDKHNRTVKASSDEETRGKVIRSILMTPLATGTGNVSKGKWAAQTVLAMKHFVYALENEKECRGISWQKAAKITNEVAETHGM
ncbi:MAG: hypothetical protein Q9165_000993 [Trypethelium subeluteriae]